MDATLIILAGGKQTRWGNCSSKMLVPILGQPLIRRTCAQMNSRHGLRPVIYSRNTDVIGGEASFWPDHHPATVIEAIAATSSLWQGEVTLLLGDVVFSDRAIAWLADNHASKSCPIYLFGKTGPNQFTGKPWPEIYGLRFLDSAGDRLTACIEETVKGPCRRKKIWELYRALLGIPQAPRPDFWYYYHPPRSRIFAEISDWTDDIDRPEEYVNMVSRLDLAMGRQSDPNRTTSGRYKARHARYGSARAWLDYRTCRSISKPHGGAGIDFEKITRHRNS